MKEKEEIGEMLREEGRGLTDILDMSQAAELLNTSKPTLYRWLGEGTITGFKAGGQWRFYRKDLMAFLKGQSKELDEFQKELNRAIEFFSNRIKTKGE
jgi:excisionase family DNA binding protein